MFQCRNYFEDKRTNPFWIICYQIKISPNIPLLGNFKKIENYTGLIDNYTDYMRKLFFLLVLINLKILIVDFNKHSRKFFLLTFTWDSESYSRTPDIKLSFQLGFRIRAQKY
ncbi:hypothetical protein BpHYR1_032023 [Brachionus plicatilis]|uniref:Uncharacterized protein n=1 Tax=Brachionus plicatilis TaxID=10195 RepID=A0A3M7T1K4_BRAPC|nr:hypothetical protein BpHYR1_032023 [Brachionus plicatilis]